MAKPEELDALRDDVRMMVQRGAPFPVLQQFMTDAQLVYGTNITLGELMRQGGGFSAKPPPREHPEMMPSQQPWQDPRLATNLPLAGLREREQRMLGPKTPPDPDALGDAASAMAAGGAATATGGMSLLAQVAGTTGATMLAGALGDTASRAAKKGPMTRQDAEEIAGNAMWRGGLNATFELATRGLAKIFSFFRGASPTPKQRTAMEYTRNRKIPETGFQLPLSAEDVAERTTAARIARAVRRFTVSGAVRAQQQGMAVARYIENGLNSMKQNPQGAVKEPSNVVDFVTDWFLKNVVDTTDESVKRLAKGVGEDLAGFDTAQNYIQQLFNPHNLKWLKRMKKDDPQLFDDSVAAWITDSIERHKDSSVGGYLAVHGANFRRRFFEENADLIKELFDPETVRAWDGFTAYMAYAHAMAKRGFPVDDVVQDAAKGATGGMVGGATALAGYPELAAQFAVGAESVAGLLGWALSKPGNPIFDLFALPFAQMGPHVQQAARGVVTSRNVAQGLVQAMPFKQTGIGSGRVVREPRPSDLRYTAPQFPPRGR